MRAPAKSASPCIAFLVLFLTNAAAFAQNASLRGQITDESGAIIAGANVSISGQGGVVKTTTSGKDGQYSFSGLAPGEYAVEATAPQLALPEPGRIALKAGAQTLDLRMIVAATAQQVTVQENAGPTLATDASANAGALVLRNADLDALADDPDDLAADLQALAGPSAGPGGPSFFIDGFSGGELPPKESIREIRINQNPFSPEYDKLGFGRIEIFTKPGADKFKGTAFYNFGDSVWNTRDPYAAQKAPFLLQEAGGNLSGAIGRRASFTLDFRRDATDNGAIINATILDPRSLQSEAFTQVFRVPQRRINVTPRIDYQLNKNNTISIRYQLTQADVPQSGLGAFNLVSRSEHAHNNSQTLQATETAVIGAKTVNETRFQLFRVDSSLTSNDPGASIQVLGAFNGGGAQTGHSSDVQNNFEFQNYTTIASGKHVWKFGARLRGTLETNIAPQDFGGTFVFGGGLAPELDANNQPVLDGAGNPIETQITSIERYRRTLLFQQLGLPPAQALALGGAPTQFTLSAGTPGVSVHQFDAGFFAGDDWRVRPNLTLNLGARYEMQTNIHDGRDIAPRIGLAWAPWAAAGKASKTVLRAGFGIFYDRFALNNTLTAARYNGILQQQFVVSNPLFYPAIPDPSVLSGFRSTQSTWEISSSLRAPYIAQSALSVERQLPWRSTIALTWANSHGLHELRSNDINAPLPGTFNPQVPGSGNFPFPGRGPIKLMESSGLFNQNQLIVNVNSNVSRNVSLFGNYTYNRAFSNTDGLATFPANPYDFTGEYGPASTDIHHRASVGGTLSAKWGLRFSPLVNASSGPPFDITTGSDLYGDTLFTARPGIAADSGQPGLIATKYGLLDPNPAPGEKLLPRNFGRGPGSVMLNLRVQKIFSFGPKSEGSISAGGGNRGNGGVFSGQQGGATVTTTRLYNLSISLQIRNLLNHTNPGPIIGNITSPLFGLANQSAGANSTGGTSILESANNRRLEMQARFTF